MAKSGNWFWTLARLAIVIATVGSSACSVLPAEQPEPQQPEKVEPVTDIPVIPATPAPVPKKAIKNADPVPTRAPLSIVLTSGAMAFADVATELKQRFDNSVVYNLAEDDRPPVTILRSINDSDSGVVVAIGRRAAVSSVAMAKKPVVFSQVFNYDDLLTETSRGVASIPPVDAQVAAWKELNPSLSRIGIIVGTGHDALIAEVRNAAEKHDIELLAHVANSDQETLFIFKRMIRNIDGYWLFPDNRVLSPRALQEIIATANRLRVPILAPAESMLAAGADISISSVAGNIAETIFQIVRQIEAGNLQNVPAMTPLSEIQVVSNGGAGVVRR